MINGIGLERDLFQICKSMHQVHLICGNMQIFIVGVVEEGLCDGMLFGRMSFANPDFQIKLSKRDEWISKKPALLVENVVI